jgi:hypothetical protein
MRIAVMSDTHDNVWALAEVMAQIQDAEAVLHCGDLCSPFVVIRIGQALTQTPIHIVWGNNDGDTYRLTGAAAEFENVHLHGLTAQLELDGWRVGVNHYPDLARDMALSGNYDLVCYGHDHTAHQEQVGSCLLVNPGEVMGLNGRRSFAWVDTELGKASFVDL